MFADTAEKASLDFGSDWFSTIFLPGILDLEGFLTWGAIWKRVHLSDSFGARLRPLTGGAVEGEDAGVSDRVLERRTH